MTSIFDLNIFHKAIPEYDGKEENLNHFIACCDLHFSTFNLEADQLKFVRSLVRKLKGRAFDFYNKSIRESWPLLKAEMKKYFSSSKSFEGYQMELGKVKQGKLSVKEFSEKIEKILIEINKISGEIRVNENSGEQFFRAQNEKLAIKAFVTGLNEPLKTILRSRIYTTIQSAVNDAIEIEADENVNRM